jgi:hypothetical protein
MTNQGQLQLRIAREWTHLKKWSRRIPYVPSNQDTVNRAKIGAVC